ncbi:DUF3857 and transglutaminase domain-containing protein [Pontibacter sp. E15-1]|uniref:DUF3857 domain-containing protein n=1 Tax=Pontibacter sp. E15-1 TaxID=2919918 RepID=UPI001F4FCA03|nr:DUF3857 domain-containing protein [Pontibacter sp. E15-1]MCJ8165759.1 DUF3857 and transglutaminase domain-containing protein [Pontibacter sp. E15-1]
MKARTFTTLLFLFILLHGAALQAQDEAAKFGKIDKAELEMRSYAPDTSAAAVILSDYAFSRFDFKAGLKVLTERHIRIKILKKSGYDWANVSIPYYSYESTRDKVTGVKGYTYNLEGNEITKDKLESKTVFEEKRNEYWYLKKFTMPNVKEGSVIDVAYTTISERVYSLDDWEFQQSIPTAWSEYRLRVPEYFDYKFLMQGYHPLYKHANEQTSGGARMLNNAYVWAMKDVPALKEEKYITSLSDYQAKIAFELQQVNFPGEPTRIMTGTWDKVVSDLMESSSFGMQLNRNNFFKDDLAAITAKHKTPEQQMQAIHELVKKRMTWNGNNALYTDNTIRKAYDMRQGNAAEINLLLTSMLKEAGLDANPVVISTRNHGRVQTTASPMKSMFNYVIAHVVVGEKEYLLDATEPLLPAGMLPFRCLNGSGRLIKKEGHRWLALESATANTKLFSATVTINGKGEIVGTGQESAGGHKALYLRKTIMEEGESKYAERISKEVGEYKLEAPVIKNLHEVGNALDISYKITASGNGQDNSIIYLNPMLGQGEKENPFKLEERLYPVDFGSPIDETYLCRFTIPSGYELDEVPKGVIVNLPEKGGRFMYVVQQDGDVVQVMSKVSINKPIFYAPEYGHLKQLYDNVVAKHAEQIVLKKIASN